MGQYYSRWHRFDNNGVKHIKRFEIDETPQPLVQDGYTSWTRGTGPHSYQALLNLRSGIQRACKGVPKSEETKHKMSIAKLGVPKTEEHKTNMKLSHQRRKLNGTTEKNTKQCMG